VGGRYYPDISDLPRQDDVLALEATWNLTDKGDRLLVTLRPRRLGERVTLANRPRVFLLVEGEVGAEEPGLRIVEQRMKRADEAGPDVPVTFDIRLAARWRKSVPFTGKPQVAVVVATSDLEMGLGQKEVLRKVQRETTAWEGVLRSDWQELAPGR
jgi:hypothetical protein